MYNVAPEKIYMTPGCAARFKGELKDLLYVQRPEMVETVAWAAANGDRSENADYQYGKRRLRQIDGRIRFLQKRLASAEIINPVEQRKIAKERVLFGATVTVENEAGEQKRFSIVGVDEIELTKGRISWASPIGKALLGRSEGDLVRFKTPGGFEELEILEVEYKAIE